MKRFLITAILDVEEWTFSDSEPEEAEWFHGLLHGEELIVHSNEIGDSIGTMRVQTVERAQGGGA